MPGILNVLLLSHLNDYAAFLVIMAYLLCTGYRMLT